MNFSLEKKVLICRESVWISFIFPISYCSESRSCSSCRNFRQPQGGALNQPLIQPHCSTNILLSLFFIFLSLFLSLVFTSSNSSFVKLKIGIRVTECSKKIFFTFSTLVWSLSLFWGRNLLVPSIRDTQCNLMYVLLFFLFGNLNKLNFVFSKFLIFWW